MIKLIRIADTEWGTFGVMLWKGCPFCVTVERRWLGNRQNVSCIPVGKYKCGRVTSPKFGETFEIKDVPDRSHILFHKGNLMEDSHGCVIVGEQFESLRGIPAVLASGPAFAQFMRLLGDADEFDLEIVNG